MALKRTGFIHFFPEGECYLWNQQIHGFHEGAFYLACRLRVPVVPVTTVLHERRLLGKSSFVIFRRWIFRIPPRVSVVIGKPVFPDAFLGRSGKARASERTDGTPTGANLRRASRLMSESTRYQMQEAIDREGGTKSLDRGMMPRIMNQTPQ